MLGYFDDQEKDRALLQPPWLVHDRRPRQVDEQGNLRIVGRKKDLINRGGHNIIPARSRVSMRHAACAKAAAFAGPDERLGERVCLAVIPRKQGGVKPLELLATSR